ncbi:MAG: zinc-binding alcohol dehydrogenase, partial [Thermoguttaceae bacterium]|nr:zinc-binding alcohol dehydrogenase [Thermoguttaceae bacterium]
MKQLLQSLRTGKLQVFDVPVPQPEGNRVLVRTEASLISAGTERALAGLARKGLLGKALARPDLVKKVLTKLRRDGLWATLTTVQAQLDRWVPLGYSAAGRVVGLGPDVRRFHVGQLVACAGAGFANHAQYNAVPELLAAAVPDGVRPEDAAYATLGAIALHGIRNAKVHLGEYVAVIGLGLLGQLTVQILRAAGCHVAGLDPVADRCKLALSGGAELALPPQEASVSTIRKWSGGVGVDAVIITAATTSSAPIELAAQLARDRARIVMVGVTGMNIPRKPYYEKELTFVVSRSYGPGRYDPSYEEHGHDYPIGYVRWTQQRNLQAFLELVAQGSVRPSLLTTHRFPIEQAAQAFELM